MRSHQRPAGRRDRWLRWSVTAALLLLPLGLAGSPADAATPDRDAGPTGPVQLPDPPSGSVLRVTSFGATPGRSSDDDSTAFRDALRAARPGDEILVPRGNYVFRTPNVVLKSGVSVRGEAGAVITATFRTSSDNAGSSLFSAPAGTTDLTVSGLRLTSSGGKALNYPLWIGGSSGANVSRILLSDLQIDRFYRMAISVRNGDNVTIGNNLIKDALSTADGGNGYAIMIGYPQSNNNRVVANVVQGPSMRHGVLLQYSAHHNLVEGNRVTRTRYDAFDLHGEQEYANEFRDNVAENCGEGGFGIGNTGAGHRNAGPDNWIHDNRVTGCSTGIHIYRGSDRQYVEHNTFERNSGYGISVHEDGARDLAFTQNTVRDNGSDGIRLVKAPGVRMLDNLVTGNKGYALRTDAATTGYLIAGNDFRNNSRGVQLGSDQGIYRDNLEGRTP